MTDQKIIEMMKEAYISVMGVEKWNNLTDEQKHDVVMILVKDTLRAVNNI